MALPPAPKRNAVGVLDDVSSAPAKRSKAQGPTAPAQGANDSQKERQQFEPATPSSEDARAFLWDCVDHNPLPVQPEDIFTAEGLERLGVALEGDQPYDTSAGANPTDAQQRHTALGAGAAPRTVPAS